MFKKIVFMGTPNFSVRIMKSLYQNGYPICSVYTQPPKQSMRGQKINESPIQKLAESLNLKIRNPNFLVVFDMVNFPLNNIFEAS